MTTFKVLEKIETYIAWLGVRFHRLAEHKNEFFQSFLPHYLVIVSLSAVASTGMFIYLKWPSLEIILRTSSIVFIAMIQVTGMFVSFGSKMEQVKSMHFQLQNIANEQGN